MSPQKLQSLLQQAVAHHRAGEFEAAAKLYRQVRALAPKAVDAWHLGGLAAYQLGRSVEAVELLTRAHQLDRKSVICEARLALALIAAGRAPEAETHLRAVVGRSPEFAEGWDNLAFCLKSQDRLADALECHRRAVAAKPDFANGWYNYGLTLAVLGQPERALECHERALAIDPAFVAARFGRAQALHLADRMVEAVEEYGRVLAVNPALTEVRSCRLFALHHVDGITREQLFAEHVAYGRSVENASTTAVPARPAASDPGRRLRLAILSPDLREHSCAYFLEPLLRHLDPAQFEVYLYHDHFRTDAISARLQALAAAWRNFVGRPAAEVEQTIRADAPEILIDLAGHTGISNRLPLFARRLAPVQVTYLGYPNTTGLTAMDYRFTDAIADPPGEADALATETLVRFAPVAWCYSPPPGAPEPAPARTGPVTFGCFNSPNKVTDTTLCLWARVLAAVPDARLLFKGAALEEPARQARYRERFVRCGLPVERIDFLGRTAGTAEHLVCYGRVDVALDTFPYHGTTTTCESLWMGVPVVSLAGDRHVSRVGVSLLTAAGHPEWIAATADDYVRIATELAGDRARLAALRTTLRDDLRRSALLDHPAQAARFAAALRECWRKACAPAGG